MTFRSTAAILFAGKIPFGCPCPIVKRTKGSFKVTRRHNLFVKTVPAHLGKTSLHNMFNEMYPILVRGWSRGQCLTITCL